MEKTIISVKGMSCEHCVNAVKSAVEGLDGVSNASVDLASNTVTVEFDGQKVTVDKIKAEIEEQGYDV